MVVAGLVISIIALVFGLIGFGVPVLSVIGLPVAIVGLILGCIGRKKPGRNGHRCTGYRHYCARIYGYYVFYVRLVRVVRCRCGRRSRLRLRKIKTTHG